MGANRHAGGKSGDRKRRYTEMAAIRSAAGSVRPGMAAFCSSEGFAVVSQRDPRPGVEQAPIVIEGLEFTAHGRTGGSSGAAAGNEEKVGSHQSSLTRQASVRLPQDALRPVASHSRANLAARDDGVTMMRAIRPQVYNDNQGPVQDPAVVV